MRKIPTHKEISDEILKKAVSIQEIDEPKKGKKDKELVLKKNGNSLTIKFIDRINVFYILEKDNKKEKKFIQFSDWSESRGFYQSFSFAFRSEGYSEF